MFNHIFDRIIRTILIIWLIKQTWNFRMAKITKITNEEPLEKQLWKTADKLRKNIDAAEYKHVVLGLIFLK